VRQVVFTALADTDIDEIWMRVARDNEAAADRLIDELHDVMRRLTMFPGMGRLADHLRPDARAFVHGNYLIVYRPMDYGIAVLRVAHGARNIELIEFPPAPREIREKPFITGYDVLTDAAQRMGDLRLRIPRNQSPAQH
jgi:toxin ParE1/3/4